MGCGGYIYLSDINEVKAWVNNTFKLFLIFAYGNVQDNDVLPNLTDKEDTFQKLNDILNHAFDGDWTEIRDKYNDGVIFKNRDYGHEDNLSYLNEYTTGSFNDDNTSYTIVYNGINSDDSSDGTDGTDVITVVINNPGIYSVYEHLYDYVYHQSFQNDINYNATTRFIDTILVETLTDGTDMMYTYWDDVGYYPENLFVNYGNFTGSLYDDMMTIPFPKLEETLNKDMLFFVVPSFDICRDFFRINDIDIEREQIW